MAKAYFELQKGDWVQVLSGDARRIHRLTDVAIDFAQTYCGRFFPARSLVGLESPDAAICCQRCFVKSADV